jgi:peptide/nickel transport system permease protein
MSGRYVTRFVVRRLATAVVLLVAISFGTFALLALTPGDPVQLLLGGRPRTPEIVQGLRETYHLNGSFLARYTSWAGSALHLDFGESISSRQDVIDVIRHKAPLTLELAGVSFLLTLLIGIPLGVLAALRRGGGLDRSIVGGTVIGVSLPPFVTGILLIYLFAVTLGWLPSFGEGDGAGNRAEHLVLPAIALTATALAIVVKMTRSAMVRELDQDYVVFARARGESASKVVVRHALRNALIPVVTAGGLILGYMVGGAVLVEQVFSLPGLGSLLVEAAHARDLPMLQGVVLVIALVVIVINLLTDLLYLAIDPRIRYGQATA